MLQFVSAIPGYLYLDNRFEYRIPSIVILLFLEPAGLHYQA